MLDFLNTINHISLISEKAFTQQNVVGMVFIILFFLLGDAIFVYAYRCYNDKSYMFFVYIFLCTLLMAFGLVVFFVFLGNAGVTDKYSQSLGWPHTFVYVKKTGGLDISYKYLLANYITLISISNFFVFMIYSIVFLPDPLEDKDYQGIRYMPMDTDY